MHHHVASYSFGLFFFLLVITGFSTVRAQESASDVLGVNNWIERGIEYSGNPLSHLVNLQSWEVKGLPPLDEIGPIERQHVAQKEFLRALRHWNANEANFSLDQVYAFLAFSHCRLAVAYQIQHENFANAKIRTLAVSNFEKAASAYRKAISNADENTKYQYAIELVECEVSSGDLNKSLETIKKLERLNLKPDRGEDYGLLRIKADLLWTLSRIEESAVVYEEWIGKGGTDLVFSPTSIIHQRLLYLKSKTGRPKNFVVKNNS